MGYKNRKSLGERKKINNNNEKQNTEILIDQQNNIKNKILFLLTNDHCIILWKHKNMTYRKIKGSLPIREGDNLTFIYSPKYGQLKIQKSIYSFIIDEVYYNNNEWLVPVAIFSNTQDKAVFRNFHILADYTK